MPLPWNCRTKALRAAIPFGDGLRSLKQGMYEYGLGWKLCPQQSSHKGAHVVASCWLAISHRSKEPGGDIMLVVNVRQIKGACVVTSCWL